MEKIEKRVLINAPVSKVWKALTDKNELKEWMQAPTTFEPVIGKEFMYKHEKTENWDGNIYCKVMEVEVNKKLSFTWNSQMISAETLVTISLSEVDGKTELSLIHSGWEKVPTEIRSQMIDGHNKGWEERIVKKLPEFLSD